MATKEDIETLKNKYDTLDDIIELLSDTIKQYKFDAYNKNIKALEQKLDAHLRSTLSSDSNLYRMYGDLSQREHITGLGVNFLREHDPFEFDYDYHAKKNWYKCSYYDGFQAPFTVFQWEGDVDILLGIITEWAQSISE